jgi:CAAX protease family protein
LPTPESEPINGPINNVPQTPAPAPRTLAPVWHTAILIAAIVAISLGGASHVAVAHHTPSRLATYATTAVLELLMLGWVAFGLRLRKIPLRSLLGSVTAGPGALARDFGIALVFWLGSFMILGTLGIFWSEVESAIAHRQSPTSSSQPLGPSPAQKQVIRTLEQLAPENAREVAAWILLCLLAGTVEEMVFRGYLQNQFIAWARGATAAGVVFSALLFGAAHGYQGVRNMALLAVFGALFSLLSLYRRGLRSCIFAHSWHDLVAGLALGVLRSHHIF